MSDVAGAPHSTQFFGVFLQQGEKIPADCQSKGSGDPEYGCNVMKGELNL